MKQLNRTRPGSHGVRSALGRERATPPRRTKRKQAVVSCYEGVFLQTR